MSFVKYNEVTLPYAFHTSFRQEVVYDDLGHTDWICTKFDIEVQAVINSDYANMIYPALGGVTDNAAVFMKAIRTALLQPRRQLQVTFNGVNLIPNSPVPGKVDAQNGPKPQYCTITQLTNTTFLVAYKIIAHYWENNTVEIDANEPDEIVTNAPGSPVLFNRWTEFVDIDELGYSKRVREGKFVIRSDNDLGAIADQLRSNFAVVGVPQGFLRKSATYTVDPSGLGLMYRIEDQEVFKNPPFPAFKATGTYSESAPMNGPLRYLEINLRLEGPKNVPQDRLVSLAAAIAMSKMGRQIAIINPKNPSAAIPVMQAVRVGMYENWVEVMVRVQTPISKSRMQGIIAISAGITQVPGSDASVAGGPTAPTPAYTDRGTASFLIQAASYYDPSIVAAGLNRTVGQMKHGKEPGAAGADPE